MTPAPEQHILVVEDNPDDAELLLRAFDGGRVGQKLVHAPSGEAALKRLFPKNGRGGIPVMVLLDLGLPKVGGHEVLRRMRADARFRHVPVVVFTSAGDPRDRDRAIEGGASLFIAKPKDGKDYAKFARWIEGLVGFLD